MANLCDIKTTKFIHREFCRRNLDIRNADVYVCNGVVYIRGKIISHRGSDQDVHKVTNLILRSLKSRNEVKDVVYQVS